MRPRQRRVIVELHRIRKVRINNSRLNQLFDAIDVLVNNAGFGLYGLLEATSVKSIRKQFETNVVGLLATTRAVVGGRVVGNSSFGMISELPVIQEFLRSIHTSRRLSSLVRYC